MAWFKKRDRVIDLTKRYKEQEATSQNTRTSTETPSSAFPSFLADIAPVSSSSPSTSSSETPEYLDISEPGEKKRKLAKRLLDMTNKIEDLSNQIYHLQQRIELLERKVGLG